MQLLTHSRQDAFKVCRRKHWFSYELGVRRLTDPKALRMGTAHHNAIEILATTNDLAAACESIYRDYEDCPEQVPLLEWQYERETVVRLACGYQWRWQNDQLEYIAAEQSFRLPLVNPETNKPSRVFELAGKIDGIVRGEDGRVMVKESKLLGDDIGPDADLWRRLRIDHQISLYVTAARELGHAVDAVLYDVTRKPTIKPTPVPCVDELGMKIVVDQHGERVRTAKGLWRQTASTADGYTMLTRDMRPDEWGDKLNADIAERPDFYYARREVARLDSDLDEYRAELWSIQKTIREAQNSGHHFRTVNMNTCGWCGVFGLCTSGWKPGDPVPEGFEIVSNIHPELGETNNGISPPIATEPAPAPIECGPAGEAERFGE